MISIFYICVTVIEIASAAVWHYELETDKIVTDTDYVINPFYLSFSRVPLILKSNVSTIASLSKVNNLIHTFEPIFCISSRLLLKSFWRKKIKRRKCRYTLSTCTFCKIVSAFLTDLLGWVLNKSTIKTLYHFHIFNFQW